MAPKAWPRATSSAPTCTARCCPRTRTLRTTSQPRLSSGAACGHCPSWTTRSSWKPTAGCATVSWPAAASALAALLAAAHPGPGALVCDSQTPHELAAQADVVFTGKVTARVRLSGVGGGVPGVAAAVAAAGALLVVTRRRRPAAADLEPG